jgi:hypothetical protein
MFFFNAKKIPEAATKHFQKTYQKSEDGFIDVEVFVRVW